MNKFAKYTLITLIVFTSAGCASITPSFTKTGLTTLEAKEPVCDVKIFTVDPKVEYDELGVIDLKTRCNMIPIVGIFAGCPEAHKASVILDVVRGDVCAAGGDAILLGKGSIGSWYTRATVVKLAE